MADQEATATKDPEKENVWRAGAIAGALAGVINVLIWTVGNAVGLNFTLELSGERQHVTMSQPFLASFVASMIATLLLWTMMKRHREGTWSRLIMLLGAISLISPLTAAVDIASGITLALMHVVVVAMLVLRVAPPRAPAPKKR